MSDKPQVFKNTGNEIVVVVIGMGYVGLTFAVYAASMGGGFEFAE